jgi:hypothetical protein
MSKQAPAVASTPHKCPHCSQTFEKKQALTRHKYDLHGAASTRWCAVCKQRFKTRTLRCRHGRESKTHAALVLQAEAAAGAADHGNQTPPNLDSAAPPPNLDGSAGPPKAFRPNFHFGGAQPKDLMFDPKTLRPLALRTRVDLCWCTLETQLEMLREYLARHNGPSCGLSQKAQSANRDVLLLKRVLRIPLSELEVRAPDSGSSASKPTAASSSAMTPDALQHSAECLRKTAISVGQSNERASNLFPNMLYLLHGYRMALLFNTSDFLTESLSLSHRCAVT